MQALCSKGLYLVAIFIILFSTICHIWIQEHILFVLPPFHSSFYLLVAFIIISYVMRWFESRNCKYLKIKTIYQFHSTGKCRSLLQNRCFPLSSSSGFTFYNYSGIEQVGSRSNICNLHFGCAWVESQSGHQLHWSRLLCFPVPPGICQNVTLNQEMDGFFHIPPPN